MRKYIKSNLLYRFFFSYLIIFMIPFLALVFLIYQGAISTLQKEIELTSLQKLDQVKAVLDREFNRLEQTALHISFDPDLTPYMVRRLGYPTEETIRTLSRYRQMATIADDVLLYFREDEVIYSSVGMSKLKTFANYNYEFNSNWSYEQFVEDINTVSYPKVRFAENREAGIQENPQMLTYLFPIPANKGTHHATVMFMIRETLLTNMIENVLGVTEGSLFIVDENFNLLSSSIEGEQERAEAILPAISQHTKPGIDEIRLNKQKYSVISVESEVNMWRYIVVIPAEQFLHSVVKVKTLVLYLAIFLLLLGLGVAFIMSVKLYRPIGSLVELVTSQRENRNRPRNEYELVRETITEAFNQSRDLQALINNQQQYVKEHMVYRLLHGDLKHSDEMIDFLENDPIWNQDHHYLVLLVSMGNFKKKADLRRQWMSEVCERKFGGLAYTYAIELMSEELTAFVCHFPSQYRNLAAIQAEVLKPIKAMAEEQLDTQVTLGAGGFCDSILRINRSYIEALTAMEYKFQAGRGTLIVFDEIQSLEGSNDWFPLKEQTKLILSIKQGDPLVAGETLDLIMHSIASREQSILIVKCMCYDLINTILKTTKEMKVRNNPSNIKQLLEMESLEDLRIGLQEWMSEICSEVSSQKDSSQTYLCDKLVEYISQNFKDYDFSLEQAADAFGLTPSYISRIFKEQIGVTFSDYTVDLRMKEIKKALLQTSKPIKDIIQEVGYIDTSSFIKKFKKIEGMTPKEFRNYYLNESED
jgi:two-component system response regulator YesN